MSTILLSLAITLGCGGKKASPEVAAPAPAPVAETVALAPEPEPEPEPLPPAPVSNADMKVTIKFGDGSNKSGHVKRIERSEDFYGETGWLDSGMKLTIEGESGTTLKNIPWTNVRGVQVSPGSVPGDVSCTYSTETNPWMYDCTLKTTGKVVDVDGKAWVVANRHKWRFTFDDDSTVEFTLYKHSARQQDEEVVDLDTDNPQNLSLYATLQERLKTDVKSSNFVTSVAVQ